jgi:hypothetical protein
LTAVFFTAFSFAAGFAAVWFAVDVVGALAEAPVEGAGEPGELEPHAASASAAASAPSGGRIDLLRIRLLSW